MVRAPGVVREETLPSRMAESELSVTATLTVEEEESVLSRLMVRALAKPLIVTIPVEVKRDASWMIMA